MEVQTNSKRARDGPIKSSKAKKQSTISNYWHSKQDVCESSDSNRFSILDTNAAVLCISAALIIWLLAEQHSSTVHVIKCPGSTLLYANRIDHLAISKRFRGCLEDIRGRY